MAINESKRLHIMSKAEQQREILNGLSIPGNGLDAIRACEIQRSGVETEGAAVIRALKERVEIKVFQHVAAHVGTEVSNAVLVL